MNRRGFMKLLGIAPAVAPAAAQSVLSDSVAGSAAALLRRSGEAMSQVDDFTEPKNSGPKFTLSKFLEEIQNDPEKQDMLLRLLQRDAVRQYPLSCSAASIDADIMGMKSLSRVGKIFAQRKRWAEGRMKSKVEDGDVKTAVKRYLGFSTHTILYGGDADDDDFI